MNKQEAILLLNKRWGANVSLTRYESEQLIKLVAPGETILDCVMRYAGDHWDWRQATMEQRTEHFRDFKGGSHG